MGNVKSLFSSLTMDFSALKRDFRKLIMDNKKMDNYSFSIIHFQFFIQTNLPIACWFR